MENELRNEPTGSTLELNEPPDSPRGLSIDEAVEMAENEHAQAALQDERLSMNGFASQADKDAPTGHRKRSYQASLLSVHAPSDCLVDEQAPGGGQASEPKRKTTRTEPIDPFSAALNEAKKAMSSQSSKVSVADDIPPLSGSKNTKYCLWNIEKDLKEIIDIYFRSCMEDKAHTDLVKQFPKPNVPALHVPELDRWLVLLQGKQVLSNLRWEQDLQVSQRNFMDAAGPLCLLLHHLKNDPESVRIDEAINLVLKSLRLLGHAVATVNKHRRQDIVKSSRITDITELGKHSDPMQKFLFGESKAKELNFVGELAEKVSKAIQSSGKKSSYKKKLPSRGEHSSTVVEKAASSSYASGQPSKKYQNFSQNSSSSSGNQYFRRGPSQGKPTLGGRAQRHNPQPQRKDKQFQQR